MKKTVVLLDSHAMLHRSFHAFPYLTTASGEPSGAIYGFANMLVHILNDFKPFEIVACFDLADDTFRHTAFEGYKAGRQKTDDSLSIQIDKAYDFVRAWNIPIVAVPGFEADDCLGALSRKYHELGYHVIIASGDRDTLQLVVDDEIVVWTLKRNIKETIIYNEEEVYNYYGFGPKLVPDYKALAGDSSDNIPGIKGIGDKTARILVSSFGSIENLYELIEKTPEVVEEKLTKRMFNLVKEGKDDAEFSKVLGTIRMDTPVEIIEHKTPWLERTRVEDIESACRMYSFNSLLPKIADIFGSERVVTKSEQEIINNEPDGTDLRKMQIARWLLDTTKTDEAWYSISSWAGSNNPKKVWEVINRELEQAGLTFVWEKIELPLIKIVHEMKEHGMVLDASVIERIGKEVTKSIAQSEKEIYKLAGEEFNINSPKQLSEILFTKMEITTKGIKKNKSGGYSTQESELEKISDDNPIVKQILEYRGMAKLLSTYIDSLPKFIDEHSRIHPELKQDGAATGRFSCSDPNIQNIPIKSDIGRQLRDAFIAPAGFSIVRLDYSQIELRIVALLSGDENMLSAFNNNQDIHTAVAAKVFNVDESEVTKEQRRRAKVINFGLLYGMGVTALSKELGTIRSEAEEYLSVYYARFPRIREYGQEMIEFAKNNGYTTTLFGRRRMIPELNSTYPAVKAYGDRIAMNAPVQGTAADIMKLAMIEADKVCKQFGAYMIAQVHDELLFEVPEDSIEKFGKAVTNALESILQVYLPEQGNVVKLTVDGGFGPSWGETKPFDMI